VVGEKIFTLADPDILISVNAHDGKILWQTEIDHTSVMKPEMREKARTDKKFIADLRREFGRWRESQLAFDRKLQEKRITVEALRVAVEMSADAGAGESLDAVGVSDTVDAALKAEYTALAKTKQEKSFADTKGYACGIALKAGTPQGDRLWRANREFDLYVTDGWGEPWTTLTFSTPCSDGSNVYVVTCNNAVAAVGLDGKIRWLDWDHNEKRNHAANHGYTGAGIGTRFCASPLLVEGKLVVNQNGTIRAYEAATGRKVWSIYNPHNVAGQFPWRPVPEATSPAWTTLTLPDGGKMAVIADGGGLLFRAEDGAIVCRETMGTWSQTPVCVGDLYIWRRSGPAVSDPRGVQRIKAVSRDKVEAENVWFVERSGHGGGGSDAYHDGRIYLVNQVFDPLTGKTELLDPALPTGKHETKVDCSCPSPIIAGGHEYCFGRRGDAWVFDLRGGPVITIRPAYQDNRVNEEKEWVWQYSWLENQQNSSPCAQANRIFWRSKGYLWCFGDPKERFPAAKDCPADALVGQ
jgi:outer membrane protein assembly factor BamB